MNILQQSPVNINKVFLFFLKRFTISRIYRKIFSGFSGIIAVFSVLMLILLVVKVVLQIRTITTIRNILKIGDFFFKVLIILKKYRSRKRETG